MKRRKFIENTGLGIVGIYTAPYYHNTLSPFKSKRPILKERKFTCEIIEEVVSETTKKIADPELAWPFENCFPNTLDTTVFAHNPKGRADTFIITGDIHAMWLRDSTAQVWPYLPFVNYDKKLKSLICGLINRQTDCLLIDPYANAFNYRNEGSQWETDETDMKPQLHERKYELDSLCYPIRLNHAYWKITKDDSPFDERWLKAMKLVVNTMMEQQRFESSGSYSFKRKTDRPTDTAYGRNGNGNPVLPNGMVCSVFRPSDDGTTFPFLVSSNLFAVDVLRKLAQMILELKNEQEFSQSCLLLADEIQKAINKFAVIDHFQFGKILAYEVDGFGSNLCMDDANVPSLLSLPYLDAVKLDDPIYQQTRKYVFSKYNAYYLEGKYASGIGGPHTPHSNIWPMSIIMRAMTSKNDHEIQQCLDWLKNSHANTGFMHESFNKDDPKNYTRSWFAWANTLFGELVLKVINERSHLLT